MSNQLSLAVREADLSAYRLSVTARFILTIIAGMINDETGVAWPSAKKLGDYAGCTQRTAQRALKTLEDAGLIQRAPAYHVAHIPHYRRPVVWSIDPAALSYGAQPSDLGVSEEPQVRPYDTGDVGPTTKCRTPYDTGDVGPTTLVSYKTKEKHNLNQREAAPAPARIDDAPIAPDTNAPQPEHLDRAHAPVSDPWDEWDTETHQPRPLPTYPDHCTNHRHTAPEHINPERNGACGACASQRKLNEKRAAAQAQAEAQRREQRDQARQAGRRTCTTCQGSGHRLFVNTTTGIPSPTQCHHTDDDANQHAAALQRQQELSTNTNTNTKATTSKTTTPTKPSRWASKISALQSETRARETRAQFHAVS